MFIQMMENRMIEEDPIKVENHYIYHFFKRITDIVVSIVALVLLSPLIIALSVIIFAQDGHNPFYKQIRV